MWASRVHPKQGGQQNGPASVERGERTPHQSRAAFEHAKDDKRVDGLEQQAEDGGNEEDDDVLIQRRRASVEIRVAQFVFNAPDQLALTLGDL